MIVAATGVTVMPAVAEAALKAPPLVASAVAPLVRPSEPSQATIVSAARIVPLKLVAGTKRTRVLASARSRRAELEETEPRAFHVVPLVVNCQVPWAVS